MQLPNRNRDSAPVRLYPWLQHRTDNVAVALLTAMFIVFILQIFFRYILNNPIGWTVEACLLCWLLLVFWGNAFCVSDHDHVRFDILYNAVPRFVRALFTLISASAIIAAFVISTPANYDFISFMKIESTSLLKIRFDVLFSIYLIFSVAIVLRYSGRIYRVFSGRFDEIDPLNPALSDNNPSDNHNE